MAAVYSTRLLQHLGLVGTHTYLVPAGFRAIVRDIDAYASAGATPKHMFFHGAAGQAIDWFVCDIDTTVVHQWRGRQVFEPGETFSIDTDDAIDVTVSGYLLTLP